MPVIKWCDALIALTPNYQGEIKVVTCPYDEPMHATLVMSLCALVLLLFCAGYPTCRRTSLLRVHHNRGFGAVYKGKSNESNRLTEMD